MDTVPIKILETCWNNKSKFASYIGFLDKPSFQLLKIPLSKEVFLRMIWER